MTSRIAIIFLVFISITFLFNCAEMHFSQWNCSEEGECPQHGNTGLLIKKQVDVLVVLENSYKMQEFNSTIAVGMEKFLHCMKPIDWRVGFVSAVSGGETVMGELMYLESEGQLSTRKFISPYISHNKKLFTDTLSLDSGCSLPPYCKTGKVQPLRAIKTFVANPRNHGSFLRESSFLTTIVIAPFVEEDEGDSSVEDVINSAQMYGDEGFMNLTVTVSDKGGNCLEVKKQGEFSQNVIEGASKMALLVSQVGLAIANPLILVGGGLVGTLIGGLAGDPEEVLRSRLVSQLASQTGGRVFNLCNPAFGQALAYSLLEKLHITEQAPRSCKKFLKKQHYDPEHHRDDVELI